MRMACRTAKRIAGSPMRPIRRLNAPPVLRSVSPARFTKRPVSIKPHVEAFTNNEVDFPTWESQSASPNLSRISLSAVPWSGIRSKASATHISNTPSSELKSYSRMKASTIAGSEARRRVRSTKPIACIWADSLAAACSGALCSSSATCSLSSRRVFAVMRCINSARCVGSSGLMM